MVAKASPSESGNHGAFGAPSTRAVALIFFAAIVAYLPAFSGDFIWNDSDYVTAPDLRPVDGLGRIWTELGSTQQYYPLLHSAFWAQHRLWGDHPLGYHVVNVLLHAASAVLFALALRRLLQIAGPGGAGPEVPGGPRELPRPSPEPAWAGTEWVAALLFALHPVHVESVAWIAEQKNTLSLAFYLAAALVYLEFDEKRGPRAYAAASVLFICALLSKTMTASLPAALLVAFWWRRGRLEWRRDVLPLLPWLALGAACGLFSGWVERSYGGARGEGFDISAVDRFLVAGRAVCFYAASVILPVRLNFVYPRWTVDAAVWWQWLFPLGVIALGAALWALRRRARAPLAAFLFFVGSLFPALGFVNLYGARYSWVWDHWQYLPDLGLLALIAGGLAACLRVVWQHARWLAAACAAASAVLLAALTWEHCVMFHDNQTLYRETIARNAGCWMAYNNLGIELDKTPSRRGEAIALYERALSLNPAFAEAHNSLGTDLEETPGSLDEAVSHYREALTLKPDFAEAHFNLGNALGRMGRTQEAIGEFKEALRFKPKYVEAHYNLGNALGASGLTEEAISELGEALRLKPDFAEAHNNLGLNLSKVPGRLDDAIAQYEEALRLDPNIPETHTNLGNALSSKPGRLDEAVGQYREALRLKPDYADAHFYLANALVQSGKVGDAIAQYEEALRARPSFAEADNNLGMLLCRMGNLHAGLERIEAAIRARPDFAQAHFSRGAALLQMGRRDEAILEYQAVLRLRPGDPSALRVLQFIENSK